MGELVSSSDGRVKLNTAMNLGFSLTEKLKAGVCEQLIEQLVEDKWLLKVLAGFSDVDRVCWSLCWVTKSQCWC